MHILENFLFLFSKDLICSYILYYLLINGGILSSISRIFPTVLVILIIFATDLLSQDTVANKYYSDLNNRHQTASKITQIDYLLNASIDELNKIPQEQFAKLEQVRFNYWDESGVCNIVYGNPNSLATPQIITFTMNLDSTLVYSNTSKDMPLVRAIARIIEDRKSIVLDYKKSNIDLSNYIINKQDTIEVFLLPTWQTSGYILNGAEYYFKYYYNRQSAEITLIDSSVITKKPVYFKGGTEEIILDYSDLEIPPIGAFVFSLMYNEYFSRIILESKKKKSYLINILDGSYAHFDK